MVESVIISSVNVDLIPTSYVLPILKNDRMSKGPTALLSLRTHLATCISTNRPKGFKLNRVYSADWGLLVNALVISKETTLWTLSMFLLKEVFPTKINQTSPP